jgi:hypothetical protein
MRGAWCASKGEVQQIDDVRGRPDLEVRPYRGHEEKAGMLDTTGLSS